MKKKYYSVDVESDGPAPGLYSMICFGVVEIDFDVLPDYSFQETFDLATYCPSTYHTLSPISEKWDPESLSISGFTREQHKTFEDPESSIKRFLIWMDHSTEGATVRPIFISDNNGYDWMFMCYYLWRFGGRNPFGFSSANINSLYKGIQKDWFASFKRFRKTKHTHNPVDDAMGNAEAFVHIIKTSGIKL